MPRRCSGRGRGGGGGAMRAANAGSGTTVTTGAAGGTALVGGSGRLSSIGASAGLAVRLRSPDWVLRVEGFLPFAVVDRFFVATAEAYHARLGTARAVDSPHGACSGCPTMPARRRTMWTIAL